MKMTLTEASFYTRRFAPFVIIAFLLLLILYFSFRLVLLLSHDSSIAPPKNLAVNLKFDKIPAPLYQDATPSAGINFTLDTIDGTAAITNATTAAQVVFLPKQPTRLGFMPRIYAMAEAIGFDTQVIKHELSGETAIFADGTRRFSININNFNFNYKYTLTKEDSILQNAQVPASEEEIRQKAIDFVRESTRYPEELAQGKSNLVYLRFDPVTTEVAIVQDQTEANMVEVDFYRPEIDGYPVVPPKYFNSPHYVVMAFNDRETKIIKAQINFFEKSEDQIGIYPLKTSDQAWQDLTSGKGVVVFSDSNSQNVKIKKVLLAYLDPEVYQEYLQPVYVFLGENNFVAYVPAIQSNYLIER